MRIIGLDPSLTSSGYADADGRVGLLKPPKTAASGPRRLIWIREAVLGLCTGADLVVIEGYAWFAEGRAAVSLGELGGVLRVALLEARLPYVEIDPNQLKQFATGKGNAKKEFVLVEAVRRLRYTGSSNDEADALWLRTMALTHYELPGSVQLPQKNLDVLRKITWPVAKRPMNAELPL